MRCASFLRAWRIRLTRPSRRQLPGFKTPSRLAKRDRTPSSALIGHPAAAALTLPLRGVWLWVMGMKRTVPPVLAHNTATPQGELFGVLLREEAGRLLTEEPPEQIWQDCEGCPGQWKVLQPTSS